MQITNVLEYLENTVKRIPDKTAYANENMEMTFGEVYHDSRAIGSYLANNNYYKEPVVVEKASTCYYSILRMCLWWLLLCAYR